MSIFVNSFDGQRHVVDAKCTDSVDSVKTTFASKLGIPGHVRFSLRFGGKFLEGSRILSDYGIQSNSSLIFSLPICGGGESNSGDLEDLAQFWTCPKCTRHNASSLFYLTCQSCDHTLGNIPGKVLIGKDRFSQLDRTLVENSQSLSNYYSILADASSENETEENDDLSLGRPKSNSKSKSNWNLSDSSEDDDTYLGQSKSKSTSKSKSVSKSVSKSKSNWNLSDSSEDDDTFLGQSKSKSTSKSVSKSKSNWNLSDSSEEEDIELDEQEKQRNWNTTTSSVSYDDKKARRIYLLIDIHSIFSSFPHHNLCLRTEEES